MAKAKRTKRHHFVLASLIAILAALALVVYVLLTIQPKNLSFGVLSLDEGYTPGSAAGGTNTNLGDEMLRTLSSGDLIKTIDGNQELDLNSYTIEFKTYETQEELDNALKSDEVAGAVVVPEDYTKDKINGVADTANGVVDVIVQKTTDPEVSQKLGDALANALNTFGVETSTSTPQADNPEDLGYQLAPDPFLHMWLILPAVLSSIALGWAYKVKNGASFPIRVKRCFALALLSAAISVLLSIGDYAMLAFGYGYEGEVMPSLANLWLMNFLAMLFFDGLAQFTPWAAAIGAALLLLISAALTLIPLENYPVTLRPWMLTTFTDSSLGFVAKGYYPSVQLWKVGEQALLGYALVGIVASLAIATFGRQSDPRDIDG